MENQKNRLFRIGEVARLFHMGIGTLRHYDKIGLLKPEFTDGETGYRYYGIRQFECLNTIRYLRVLDMPLDEIRDFLDSRDTDKIQELLLRQQEEVKRRQAELQKIEGKIRNRLSQIEDALNSGLEEIRVVKKPPARLALLKTEVRPETYLDLEYAIRQLEETEPVVFLGKVGVGISKERLESADYETYDRVFVVLEETDRSRGEILLLPEETCISLRFQGTHRQAAGHYERLMGFIREQGYNLSGFSREVTLIDEGLTYDSSKFVTEILIPVKENGEQEHER